MTKQVVSADGTQFFFDATPVGGVEDYTVFDGITPDVPHRPMAGPLTFHPGQADYGQVRVRLYRNQADPGQVKMEQFRAQGRVANCAVILKDGTIRQFRGYVKQLPLMGGNINGTGLVTAVIKVAGPPQ
jgi:hypothetical protein